MDNQIYVSKIEDFLINFTDVDERTIRNVISYIKKTGNYDDIRKRVINQRRELRNLHNNINLLKGSWEREYSDLYKQIEYLRNENDRYQRKNENLHGEIKTLKEDLWHLDVKYGELKVNTEWKDKISNGEIPLGGKDAIKKYVEENNVNEKVIIRLQKENEDLKKEIDKLQEHIINIKNSHTKRVEELMFKKLNEDTGSMRYVIEDYIKWYLDNDLVESLTENVDEYLESRFKKE